MKLWPEENKRGTIDGWILVGLSAGPLLVAGVAGVVTSFVHTDTNSEDVAKLQTEMREVRSVRANDVERLTRIERKEDSNARAIGDILRHFKIPRTPDRDQ